jgi:hypothetical protein
MLAILRRGHLQGDLMAYINSDDMSLPGTLAYVAGVLHRRHEVDIIYGQRIFVDRDGLEIGRAVLRCETPDQQGAVERILRRTAKDKTLQVKLWAGELRLCHGI